MDLDLYCPLFEMAELIRNKKLLFTDVKCKGEYCAWWNTTYGTCAIPAIIAVGILKSGGAKL